MTLGEENEIQMNIVFLIIAWVVGLAAGSFFIIPPLIVLFFGIPFTLKLKRKGAIQGNGPIPSYLGSLIILPILFGLVTWGVSSWLPDQMIAYWVGVGITLLTGLGKCGANATNVSEYLDNNSQHIDPTTIDQIRP